LHANAWYKALLLLMTAIRVVAISTESSSFLSDRR